MLSGGQMEQGRSHTGRATFDADILLGRRVRVSKRKKSSRYELVRIERPLFSDRHHPEVK